MLSKARDNSKPESQMRQSDYLKIEEAMHGLLKGTIAENKTLAFIVARDFLHSAHLSSLTARRFWEWCEDFLTGKNIQDAYGDWILTEYESDVKVLIQLSAKGEIQSIHDPKNHFPAYGKHGKSVTQLRPPKKVKVEVPEGLTAEEVTAALEALAQAKLEEKPKLIETGRIVRDI